MDYLQLVGAAITLGSVLGGIVAGFFAARQKSRTVLLEEMNSDYEKRVKQLEDDRDQKDKKISDLEKSVDRLEAEKRLPLEKLTKLIITQHSENQESIMQLTQALVAVAGINMPKSNKGKKK